MASVIGRSPKSVQPQPEMSSADALIKLSTARLMACRLAPYLTFALIALVPRERRGLGTFAVTHRGIMLYDPAVIARWTVKQIAAVLLHEVSHVVRDHHGRCQHLPIAPNAKRTVIDGKEYHHNATLWNTAGDAAINQDLIDMGLDLPDSPVTPEALELPRSRTAEEYYALLTKQQEEQEKKREEEKEKGEKEGGEGKDEGEEGQEEGGEGDGTGEGQGEGAEGKGQGDGGEEGEGQGEGTGEGNGGGPSKGSGQGNGSSEEPPKRRPCGSGAGNAIEGEPDADDPDGRTPTDLQRVRLQVAEAVRKEAAKGRGNVPAGWTVWAEEFSKPARIPWQQKLARAVRRAVAFKSGCVDYRYDKPSRRQAGVGYGAGHPVMPRLFAPVPNVAVGVDTSGSMGTTEMERALAETKGVLSALGAPVTFLACDAEVHSLGRIKDVKQAVKMLKGGGGTDFRPVFAALAKERNKVDILVFVTDGCGPAPAEPPKGTLVIWVLIGSYKRKPTCETGEVTWGEFIEVEEDEAQAA